MSWNKRLIYLLVLTNIIFLSGCSYSARPLLGMGLKTIAIESLENSTYEHSLEILVTEVIRDEFIFDGTLRVVDRNRADLLLSGAVIDYIFEPQSYDEDDNAESYQLRIRTRLTLKDLKEDKFIWQNKIVEGDVHYLLVTSLAETETQARIKALEDLAEEILRQTIDIW